MRRSACLLRFVLMLSAFAVLPATAEDASVASRLDARGLKYVVDEDGDYQVTFHYAREDRTQLAFVSGRTESIGGFEVREVFSPAARVERDGIDGAKALALLAESGLGKIGSWEIRGDVLLFVIKLPDSIDASQLESALDIVAELADNKEIELSGDRDEL